MKQNHYNFEVTWKNKNTGEEGRTPFFGFRSEDHVRQAFYAWPSKLNVQIVEIQQLTKNPK